MAGLKFRVLLDTEKENEIFRDIIINSDDNFESFYLAIMKSFQFSGAEMASIYVSNDNWDKGHEISLEDLSYGDEAVEETPSIMKNTKISEFIEEPDQKFILVYDFMRMWIFLIELIGYENGFTGAPVVALSVGMAPPEDSKSTENQFFGEEDALDEDEDEFGFNDYDDDLSDDDYSSFDDYEY